VALRCLQNYYSACFPITGCCGILRCRTETVRIGHSLCIGWGAPRSRNVACVPPIQKYYYASNFVPLSFNDEYSSGYGFQYSTDPITLASAFCQMSYRSPSDQPSSQSLICLLSAQNSSQKSYFFPLRLASVVLNGLYKYRRYSLPLEDDTEFSRDLRYITLWSL
jgi:hypothetical protein